MKAPDKIYVEIRHPFGNEFTEMLGFESRGNSDDIEYIRKGAIRNFIFKMIDALNDRHLLDAAIHCTLNGIIDELDSL